MNVEGNDIVIRFSADTGQANRSIKKLTDSLGKLRDALSGFEDGLIDKLDRIADAINRIGKSSGSVSGLTKELKKLDGVSTGKAQEQMKELASVVEDTKAGVGDIQQRSGGASGFFSQLGEKATKAAEAMAGFLVSLPKKELDSLRSRLERVAKGFKTFIASIGRIAFYRAIRTAIKAVTQGFQEGIKNAYFWAKEVGNQFAASMDTIKTATNYLKNSLGAMVAPLLNSLAPAIDFVIDRFVDLLNIVNQVFALLGGQSTWFKALKYPAEYMEETAGATAKARKELKLWLASFDELNIIPNQKDTGRGGGAGDQQDWGSMFEEVDLQNPLKEAIESGDWEGLGRLIAEKLNGLFDAVDFSGAGEKLGKSIGKVIDIAYGFMKTLDFSKIGRRFGEYVSSAIANINWKNFGRLTVRKWTALIDMVVGFLGGLNWNEVGKAFGNIIKGKLEELTDWIGKIDWHQAGITLVDKIIDFFAGLDLDTIVNDFGNLLVTAFDGLWTFVKAIFERLWEHIQYQIYLDTPWMAKAFGIQGEELAKKFGEGLDSEGVKQTKGAMDDIRKTVDEKAPETQSAFERFAEKSANKLLIFKTNASTIKPALDAAYGDIKEFSQKVDKTFAVNKKMWLSVDIGDVRVPKFKVDYDSVTGVPVITAKPYNVNIPMAYANGGFPEDGLFYANHGELVGKFNNGKTAVANNEQIIEGIKRGVAEGMSESGQGGNIYLQANLDGKVLFDAVCDRITDYFVQTGMTPFPV